MMDRTRKEALEPRQARCFLIGPDGTHYEMAEGYEERLPPEVRVAWDRRRSEVVRRLIEGMAERDDPLGEAIRLYRSIPKSAREMPEVKELNKAIVDAIRRAMGNS